MLPWGDFHPGNGGQHQIDTLFLSAGVRGGGRCSEKINARRRKVCLFGFESSDMTGIKDAFGSFLKVILHESCRSPA